MIDWLIFVLFLKSYFLEIKFLTFSPFARFFFIALLYLDYQQQQQQQQLSFIIKGKGEPVSVVCVCDKSLQIKK